MTELNIEIGYIPGAIGRVAEFHGKYYNEKWTFGLVTQRWNPCTFGDQHWAVGDLFDIQRQRSWIEQYRSVSKAVPFTIAHPLLAPMCCPPV